MSDSASDIGSASNASPSGGGARTIVIALAFLIFVGGGSYLIRTVYSGATLIVNSDAAATAVLNTSAVTLHDPDGTLRYTLRPGTQSVRPGRYQIRVNWDETVLTFSTGEEFEAKNGEQLQIDVTGESVEP